MSQYVGPALPPFDPQARCPKCGGEMGTRYHWTMEAFRFGHRDSGDLSFCGHVFDDWLMTNYNQRLPDETSEHLHRVCVRCGYEWLEACIPEPAETSGTADGARREILAEVKVRGG